MSELPKGWALSNLSGITSLDGVVSDGDWVESKDQDPNGDVRLIQLADIGDGKFINKSNRFMNNEQTNRLGCTFLEEGDVLIARMPDPLGRACLFPELSNDAVTVVDVCLVRLTDSSALDNKLFMYWVNSPTIRNLIDMQASGTTRRRITRKKLALFDFPIPPLNEQIRIVDKLDSMLAKVDAAQARLDKIPYILKRFRQSVLAAATSGELTKEWRKTNKTTFKSDWSERAIKDITLKSFDGPFGSKLKTADYTLEGVKVARLENIGHLKFISHKETFVSEEKFTELKKHKLEHNDVLFSSFVDEDIRVCLFDIKHGTYINKADCFCLRPDESKVVPEFLSYFLASRKTFEEAKKQVHGATRPRINLKFLKSLTLYIPSLLEQKEVVRRIELLFSDADKVEKKYLNAKDHTNRLTQSILAKAFRGELVSQDESDEPASELLARIKEQAELLKPRKKAKK